MPRAVHVLGFAASAALGLLAQQRLNSRHRDALQVRRRLEQSHAQLRQLSAALQSIREEERTHIARELHDDLGQLLATLRLDLTLLKQSVPADAATGSIVAGMDELIVRAIASLRRIASNLRPRALDEGGLYFALHSLRQDFLGHHAIHFDLLADEAELALDDTASTAIYRIVQEALTNISRHAQARHVTVALHRLDSELGISIQDDGRGIVDGDMEKAASFGLLGMRERVWGLRGEISIGASDDGGTRIDITLPLREDGTSPAQGWPERRRAGPWQTWPGSSPEPG